VGGKPADGSTWIGGLVADAAVGGRGGEGAGTEVVCGDDAVVENRENVRLGGEQAEGGRVALTGGRLDDGDSEVIVALGEVNACGADPGFRIAGNGGVAVENEIAMGDEAGGVDLGSGDRGKQKREKDCVCQSTVAEPAGVSLRRWDGRFTAKEHGTHLVVALRYASAKGEFALGTGLCAITLICSTAQNLFDSPWFTRRLTLFVCACSNCRLCEAQ
jgi:hypothetical protein